jgi:hypothetical protein
MILIIQSKRSLLNIESWALFIEHFGGAEIRWPKQDTGMPVYGGCE